MADGWDGERMAKCHIEGGHDDGQVYGKRVGDSDRGGRGRDGHKDKPLVVGFKFLECLQQREPADIVLTLSNPNTGFREGLFKCVKKPELLRLMLHVLAKAFTCNSTPEQLNRVYIIIKESQFFETSMTYFLDMQKEDRVHVQTSFRQPIKDMIAIMGEFAVKYPASVIQFVGIYAVLKTVIDDLRETADNVIDDELLKQFRELTENRDRLINRGARRRADWVRQGKCEQVSANQNQDTAHMQIHFMDPRAVLTLNERSKEAVHITQFLTEKCKRLQQSRRKEFVLRAGSNDLETPVPENDQPYLGIFIEEWGAANMRLLNHLLSTGELPRDKIEFYLAYTTQIFEFADIYEWSSIMNFDYIYRELQAEYNFQWGTFSPHMDMLIPKRARQNQAPLQHGTAQQAQKDCHNFKAYGSCPFCEHCRYRH